MAPAHRAVPIARRGRAARTGGRHSTLWTVHAVPHGLARRRAGRPQPRGGLRAGTGGTRWEVYDGDPVAFVVEANAEDRNLSTGQRAMAVAIGLVDAGLRSNGRFRRGSVPEHPLGVTRASWRDKVALAGFVLDHARARPRRPRARGRARTRHRAQAGGEAAQSSAQRRLGRPPFESAHWCPKSPIEVPKITIRGPENRPALPPAAAPRFSGDFGVFFAVTHPDRPLGVARQWQPSPLRPPLDPELCCQAKAQAALSPRHGTWRQAAIQTNVCSR